MQTSIVTQKARVEQLTWEFLASEKLTRDNVRSTSRMFGLCYDLSDAFSLWLKRRNIHSELVELHGFMKKLPDDAHPEWHLEVLNGPLWHWILKVGEWYVDITSAQYGKVYAGPRFLTWKNVCDEWEDVS